jgi:hypothetical protein
MPGVIIGLILHYVQPRVANTNVGTTQWVIAIFVAVTAFGLLRSWWWWHAAEKRYQVLRNEPGS